MKRTLAAGLAISLVFSLAAAQKRSTILGDAWTGEVVSTDDSTREIRIKFEEKGKTETFTGVLVEGYAMKFGDGNSREIKVSEIPAGTRVRVFARTKEQKTAGGKVKINRIFRIDFVGRDEFSRLRAALNLDPSAPAALNDSGRLPAANPLKVHLVIANEWSRDAFARWLGNWNEKRAAKYGALEVVPGFAEADVSLVMLEGAENILITPAMLGLDNMAHATAFLAVRKGDGLEVLWKQVLLTRLDGPPAEKNRVTAEFEKRLKARSKK